MPYKKIPVAVPQGSKWCHGVPAGQALPDVRGGPQEGRWAELLLPAMRQ